MLPATNARRHLKDDDTMAGGHFVLGFQSTLCASAGSILIGLLGRKDCFCFVDWTLLLSDRNPTILSYCILQDTVGPSFSATYSSKWLCFSFGYLSVFQIYCSSQLIIHGNLFEVDILGLADLAGDIFIIWGKGT